MIAARGGLAFPAYLVSAIDAPKTRRYDSLYIPDATGT